MYGYGYYGVPKGAGVVGFMTFAGLVAGIVLYFTVFSTKHKGQYKGFMGWLYDFMTFRKLILLGLLKFIYIVSAVTIFGSCLGTILTFSLPGFLGGLLGFVLGELLLRLCYELSIQLVLICQNTMEINQYLNGKKADVPAFVEPDSGAIADRIAKGANDAKEKAMELKAKAEAEAAARKEAEEAKKAAEEAAKAQEVEEAPVSEEAETPEEPKE